jgi:hypothetical protein
MLSLAIVARRAIFGNAALQSFFVIAKKVRGGERRSSIEGGRCSIAAQEIQR